MCNQPLGLPAEIRLQIYDYIIPLVPLSKPRSDYVGLLYTSKQIRSEFEPEILKAMRPALVTFCNTVRRGTDSITFKEFHTFHELENPVMYVHTDCVSSSNQLNILAYHRGKLMGRVTAYRFNVLTVNVTSTGRYAAIVRRATWWGGFVMRYAFQNERLILPVVPILQVNWRRADIGSDSEQNFLQETWPGKITEVGLWDYDEEKDDEGRVIAVTIKRR
ncbi:hypothetical protein DE146DRAFT_362983 [Phaeosphaeria sp. MPI-PUGE-AT-0046c]|nr:hypothetical protein DE146DRAFT_362983 [Phaeosphaeria sp. MPI-PUGE-AT-0046c]